jgi:hypothetical protein
MPPDQTVGNAELRASCTDWQTSAFDEPLASDIPHLRRICAACPLATACYRDALADPDAVGFRAGTTEADRHTLRRRAFASVQRQRNADPTCRRCGDPRQPRQHYCPPCRTLARDETHRRSAARRLLRNLGDYATT